MLVYFLLTTSNFFSGGTTTLVFLRLLYPPGSFSLQLLKQNLPETTFTLEWEEVELMARLDIAVFPDRAYIPLADLGVTGFGRQLPLVVAVHCFYFSAKWMMLRLMLLY